MSSKIIFSAFSAFAGGGYFGYNYSKQSEKVEEKKEEIWLPGNVHPFTEFNKNWDNKETEYVEFKRGSL